MKLLGLAIFGLAITAFAQNQVVTTTAQSSKPANVPEAEGDGERGRQKSSRERIERPDHHRNLC